jgi:hypothetical protein
VTPSVDLDRIALIEGKEGVGVAGVSGARENIAVPGLYGTPGGVVTVATVTRRNDAVTLLGPRATADPRPRCLGGQPVSTNAMEVVMVTRTLRAYG